MVQPREVRSTFAASAQLRAYGPEAGDVGEFSLAENQELVLGRSAGCDVVISWDTAISRRHAHVRYRNNVLHVTCLAMARNPLWVGVEALRETIVRPGETFRIGKTSFSFSVRASTKEAITEEMCIDDVAKRLDEGRFNQTFTPDQLKAVSFGNSGQQLDVLSRLPDVVATSTTDAELGHQLCQLLMEAIPHATAVAVAHFDPDQLPKQIDSDEPLPKPITMRVVTRDDFDETFRPSRRIVVEAIHEQASVLHIWRGEVSTQFTMSAQLDWAICSPVHAESCRGWCMYVSGRGQKHGGGFVSEGDLKADVRFTELVAQFIGSFRQVRLLQDRQSRLSAFFSPNIAENISLTDELTSLQPAERATTVLFCDVRGFSHMVEQARDDLLRLLDSVRGALGIMVDGILEQDGTIADFQGDAAVGFWGWPLPLEYGPIPACRAALAIQKQFAAAHPPGNETKFSVGIGVAYGTAVAGQIGTDRQSKIGVFGPVVNQCARLESLTKQLGVSICIDAATAEFVDRYLSSDEARLRPLARVRPHGMTTSLDVHELIPGTAESAGPSDDVLASFTKAYEAVVDGRWDEARLLLDRVPEDDGPRQFLLQEIERYGGAPPADWEGSFQLTRK